MRTVHYAYCDFGGYDLGLARLGGPGLGNMLFPWARFVCGARDQQLRKLQPTWSCVKLGPLIRRERDKRFYGDLFVAPSDYVGGWRRLLVLYRTPRASEDELARPALRTRTTLFEFSGMGSFFAPFLERHELLRSELLRIVAPRVRAAVDRLVTRPFVGVHVRLGDFQAPNSVDKIESGAVNKRIPLPWFRECIARLRPLIGELPVFVFSDGQDDELRELLAVPGVQRASAGSSAGDMLALSRARLLIASGSTFSMWASFLGRMPVIWHKGQLRCRLYPRSPDAEIEVGSDFCFPEPFRALVRRSQASEPSLARAG